MTAVCRDLLAVGRNASTRAARNLKLRQPIAQPDAKSVQLTSDSGIRLVSVSMCLDT